MKQKDLALVLVIVFISAAASLVVSRLLFASPKNQTQKAEKVDIISAEFTEPSRKYFNADSINPTQQIQIGSNSNPNPFGTKSQ